MQIELHKITVRELTQGYEDNAENGVRAYSGKLDVRPPYQREFVYKDKQRDAVIDTLTKGFPLNVMYWAVRADGTYEIIDGQQRTISICQYVNGDFAYMFRYFHNLQPDEQQQILDYELNVYICSGSDSEKLKWFKTINIAGEELTEQELRNAVYAGSWGQALLQQTRLCGQQDCLRLSDGIRHSAGLPGNGHLLDFRRQHRGLHVQSPARRRCCPIVAVLPIGRHVDGKLVSAQQGTQENHERR